MNRRSLFRGVSAVAVLWVSGLREEFTRKTTERREHVFQRGDIVSIKGVLHLGIEGPYVVLDVSGNGFHLSLD